MNAAVRWALPRLYFASYRFWTRVFSVVGGVVDGVWLGLLDDEHLGLLDQHRYQQDRQYVDDGYNERGLWAWEEAAVRAHFLDRDGPVLVTGAGGGREVLALRRMGVDAIGWEPNATLVTAGRTLLEARGEPAALHVSPRDGWPPDTPPAGGVIVGWGAYHHIRGRQQRVDYLSGARATLAPGSPLLVSFFTREGSNRLYYWTVWATATALAALRGGPRPDLGDGCSPTYVHFFTQSELRAEMAAAGFDMTSFSTHGYGHAVGIAR